MFIGHFAVAFALKRATPRTSLGTLIAGAQALDLLWPAFLLAGWEHVRIDPGNTAFTPLAFDSYPYSHSLLMACAWGALAGAVYFWRTRWGAVSALLSAAVVSHWVLDWITHRPDLALTPAGTTRFGLGLWNSVPATIAVEGAMLAVGVWTYTQATRARDRLGVIGLWTYVGVLVAVYLGNVLGPPPPDVRTLALTAFGLWIFVLWAGRVDAHRVPSPPVR
jgi:membrane-bound metal-dependent hydrolase YbcI (DUF457 family)